MSRLIMKAAGQSIWGTNGMPRGFLLTYLFLFQREASIHTAILFDFG